MAKNQRSGKQLKTYLVGGAVRDQLLQIPSSDKDYLVVGASPEQLLALGYQSVGKDFPVFLHPKTKQEYALARTERKQGHGYSGFACYYAPDVTVEQDLLRRDLTINAMAQDLQSGELIDPYGGQADIQHKLLRHVSDAFVEDPLRVLRVARFYARFYTLGFQVAAPTLQLMQQLSASGELQHLAAERVWQETGRALAGPSPQAYFELLHQAGALQQLMPELAQLWHSIDSSEQQPAHNAGQRTMQVLAHAAAISPRLDVRFAALCFAVGKEVTTITLSPSQLEHQQYDQTAIRELCQRLRVPNDCRDLALLAGQYQQWLQQALELEAATVLKLLDGIDYWRKPERLELLLLCCLAEFRGRGAFNDEPYPPAALLQQLAQSASAVSVQEILAAGYAGLQIKQQLAQARLTAIELAQQQWLTQTK